MRHQRCVWHGKHDFPCILYTERLKKPDQKPFLDQLNTIAAMTITKAQLENIKAEDRAHVRQLAQQTRRGFEQLLKALEPYPKARAYIENLVKPVTAFPRW